MGDEIEYIERRVDKLEESIEECKDSSLVQALIYMCQQKKDEPITRDDLYNVLIRFKIIQ